MVRERTETLSRTNVLQLGLALIALGVIGYSIFLVIALDGQAAGIASQTLLVLLVFGWTGSYLFRVFTGKMTFVEQRKRYLEAYEKMSNEELQSKFDSMSKDEQVKLLKDFEGE